MWSQFEIAGGGRECLSEIKVQRPVFVCVSVLAFAHLPLVLMNVSQTAWCVLQNSSFFGSIDRCSPSGNVVQHGGGSGAT